VINFDKRHYVNNAFDRVAVLKVKQTAAEDSQYGINSNLLSTEQGT